jgi:hypothetical protein
MDESSNLLPRLAGKYVVGMVCSWALLLTANTWADYFTTGYNTSSNNTIQTVASGGAAPGCDVPVVPDIPCDLAVPPLAVCEDACCPHVFCGCWTASVDLLLWQRGGGDGVSLIFADGFLGVPGNPGPEIFNARDLTNDFQPGPRVSLCHCLTECCSLEASFFAIDSWTSSGSRPTPLHVTFPGFVQAFLPPPDGVGIFNLGTDLYSTELNLRRRTGDWFTLLAGFRWIELHDLLTFQFQPNGGAPVTGYTIDANNHLYGFQVGGLIDVWYNGPWSVSAWGKAGVYHNSADQLTNVFIPAVGTVGDQDDNTAVSLDIALTATRQLNDWLALRLGYQFLWIDGVALAPDQLLGTNDVTVPIAVLENDSDVFFHGAFVGLEASW